MAMRRSDLRVLSDGLNDWVERHENDSGGQSFMERHEITCHVLHCLSEALRDTANNEYTQLDRDPSNAQT